jgi:hypothetical protein
MYTSPTYHTNNPNSFNNIRAINDLVTANTVKGNRKSVSKKVQTNSKVHGNNGNSLLKDNYFGF